MEGIQPNTPSCSGPPVPAGVDDRFSASQLRCLNVCQEQEADLDIWTAEGDHVTLSADYRAEVTFATYRHLARSDAGYRQVAAEMLDFKMEREIVLSVEGDLNEQELNDIKTLLSDLGAMLRDFFAGGASAPPAVNADALELGSLSSVRAHVEYNASAVYARLATAKASPAAADASQPVAAEVGAPAAAVAEAPAQASAPAAADSPAALPAEAVSAETAQVAERMAQRVKESGVRPRRLFKLLKRFMRRFMKDMAAQGLSDAAQAKQGESILEKFMGKLRQMPAEFEISSSRVSFQQTSVKAVFEYGAGRAPAPAVEETA